MSNKYVKKLKYLNYCTIFAASGDLNVPLRDRACFADVLNIKYLNKEHYEIYIVRDENFCLKQNASHLCLLDESGIKKHLKLARRLFPFSYNVEKSEYNGMDAFKINIDLEAAHIYHRYLLTWVRFLWEFPYNLILIEALRMKHAYLPKESITNLIVVCTNSYNNGPCWYNAVHGIYVGESSLLKERDLKDALLLIGQVGQDGQVNDLYPSNDRASPIRIEPDENSRYLEYWQDPAEFNKRAKVYLKEYKRLKAKQ